MSVRRARAARHALTQLELLLGVWWRRMRRRPLQVGAPPRSGGAPTFVLLNVLVLGSVLPNLFFSLRGELWHDLGYFPFQLLAVTLLAFGSGLAQGAGVSFDGSQRGDGLALVLPLSLFARLGGQFAAAYQVFLFTLMVPLAAASATEQDFEHSLLALLLGCLSFVLISLLAQAAVCWARARDFTSAQRYGTHLGTGCMVLGGALCFAPLRELTKPRAAWLVTWFASEGPRPFLLLAAILVASPLAYFALAAAERAGFDRGELVPRAPRALSLGTPSRAALELRMITRQGGLRQLVLLSLLLFAAPFFVPTNTSGETRQALLYGLAWFAVYVGGLSIIGQAGMAVRRDLKARAFLSGLPVSPYQVLVSKRQTLRLMPIPASLMLIYVLSRALVLADYGLAYGCCLALVALYYVVEGATGVAFMSHGVGMVGADGGDTTSSFFTFLLLVPLMTTIINNPWGATMSLFAVLAIAHEAQRAAHSSVRWIDDPDTALTRDTGVWRALLVLSAFFNAQGFLFAGLTMVGLSPALAQAAGFGLSSVVLVMLTQRGLAGERPRIAPTRAFYWLLAGALGVLSAVLARKFAGYVLEGKELDATGFSAFESIAFGAMAIVAAPIAEEYFFRGWLQSAIEHDLPAGKKQWAFVLAAAAFAMAHVGSYGVPQLIVGLFAGFLYARGRGLGPAMIVHAVHNGLASFWPP